MENKILTREELLKISKSNPQALTVEQALITQDLSLSMNAFNTKYQKVQLELEHFAQIRNPVPPLTLDVKERIDNFTQSVMNTYRVEIKPLFPPVLSKN